MPEKIDKDIVEDLLEELEDLEDLEDLSDGAETLIERVRKDLDADIPRRQRRHMPAALKALEAYVVKTTADNPTRPEASVTDRVDAAAKIAYTIRLQTTVPADDFNRVLYVMRLECLSYCGDRVKAFTAWSDSTDGVVATALPDTDDLADNQRTVVWFYECWRQLSAEVVGEDERDVLRVTVPELQDHALEAVFLAGMLFFSLATEIDIGAEDVIVPTGEFIAAKTAGPSSDYAHWVAIGFVLAGLVVASWTTQDPPTAGEDDDEDGDEDGDNED